MPEKTSPETVLPEPSTETATSTDWFDYDQHYLWHPYSAVHSEIPVFPVTSAKGVRLRLSDGTELIDGMSSWWCAIHGYNVTELNQAVCGQLDNMAHIMFGGLSHKPAALLAAKLVAITPESLQHVFFTDSGSVAVEVAMKMAIQYWHAKQQADKQSFISLRQGYHGDTFGAMSVCDPVTGMHTLFSRTLMKNFFIRSPSCRFNENCTEQDLYELEQVLEQSHHEIAALILEPVVQGAGGMKFYSPDFLIQAQRLCQQYQVLLICDEIATGFGRTGRLFACEHADISPDIMCLGKSLTGGYMTLAATLCSSEISHTISTGDPGVFMHGPTFMANPLACSVALRSIELLLESPWQSRIKNIETILTQELNACQQLPCVKQVRVLGAIGVVECHENVDMKIIQQQFIDAGVWIRPFGKLVYLMPPFIISNNDLRTLTSAIHHVLKSS